MRVLIFLLLTGCGVVEHLADQCGDNLPCQALLGSRNNEQDARLRRHNQDILDLQRGVGDLRAAIDALSLAGATYQTNILGLQTRLDNEVAAIYTILSGVNDVAAILDPCGDGVGWDEVFLRLADGTIVASFSDNVHGENTRFTILPHTNGVYVTTDGTSCVFKVKTNGAVCWGAGYATCI